MERKDWNGIIDWEFFWWSSFLTQSHKLTVEGSNPASVFSWWPQIIRKDLADYSVPVLQTEWQMRNRGTAFGCVLWAVSPPLLEIFALGRLLSTGHSMSLRVAEEDKQIVHCDLGLCWCGDTETLMGCDGRGREVGPAWLFCWWQNAHFVHSKIFFFSFVPIVFLSWPLTSA